MPLPQKSRIFLRYTWATWVTCIIIGSLLPDTSLPMQALDRLHLNDRLEHFVAYFAAVLIQTTTLRSWTRSTAVALSMIALGVVLELLQNFSPGRTPDIFDALSDTLGVLTGTALGLALRSIASAKGAGRVV